MSQQLGRRARILMAVGVVGIFLLVGRYATHTLGDDGATVLAPGPGDLLQ